MLLTGIFCSHHSYSQCVGCQVMIAECDSASNGQVCVVTLNDGEAGAAFEQQISFRFPRRLAVQTQDLFPIALPGFPSVITLDVIRVQLKAIEGLPPGLQWECDSSANNCQYLPGFNAQHGCVTICGMNDCETSGNFPLTFKFDYIYNGQDFLDALNGGGSPFPFPFPIANELPMEEIFSVGLTVNAGNAAPLSVVADKPTIISLGEEITLTATAGFSSYLWSTGDTTASITIEPTGSANYTVEVEDENGCTQEDTIGVTVLLPSTVDEFTSFEKNLKIFPVPASGDLNILFPAFEKEITITISDNTGRLIHEEKMESNTSESIKKVSLPPLEAGVYLINIRSVVFSVSRKIIIH